MNRGYHVENYTIWPMANNPQTYAFETENHANQYHRGGRPATVNHNKHYLPVMETTTTEVLYPTNLHEKRMSNFLGTKDHRNSAGDGNHGKYQDGQRAKGDYLEYVSHLETMPSMALGMVAPRVPYQHGLQDKEVVFEEYVTTDEEYDPDTNEVIKRKVTTRVEKRAVNW
ncbi:hypothetical protein ACHQM5_011042 [Ranunculus cassubicifolius]